MNVLKLQLELCSNYDKNDFDILMLVVPCHMLRWIYISSIQTMSCDKLRYQVIQQFLSKEEFILSCDIFNVASEVTIHRYCKTHRYWKRCIFSFITCEVLQHAAKEHGS